MKPFLPVSKMDGVLTVKRWKHQLKEYRIPYKYVLTFSKMGRNTWNAYLLSDCREIHNSSDFIGVIQIRGKLLYTNAHISITTNEHVLHDPYPRKNLYNLETQKIYFGNSIKDLFSEYIIDLF